MKPPPVSQCINKPPSYSRETNRTERILAAVQDGNDVVIGNGRTLLVDFDDCEWLPDVEERLNLIREIFGKIYTESWRSSGGEGWHLKVTVPLVIPIHARIALQAALGSDWKREMLSVRENLNNLNDEPFLIRPGLQQAIEVARNRPLVKPNRPHVVCGCNDCKAKQGD